jgi:hypothetical protein
VGVAALDLKRFGEAQDLAHHLPGGAGGGEVPEHGVADLRGVEWAQPGADPQLKSSQPVTLRLDELVVGGDPAESRRQDLLDQCVDLRAQEVHPLRGQLLVAADRVKVRPEPGRRHSAATVS